MESPHIKFSATEHVMNNVHMNNHSEYIYIYIYGLVGYIKVKGITTNQIISCSRFDAKCPKPLCILCLLYGSFIYLILMSKLQLSGH